MDKIRVLIADDEPSMLRAYERMLGKDYDVCTAEDGGVGLDALKGDFFKPDIILSDYDMGIGYMNGTSFCEAVRKTGSKIPFVLISGNADVRELAEKCGANIGLSKPAGRRLLVAVIAKLVKEARDVAVRQTAPTLP